MAGALGAAVLKKQFDLGRIPAIPSVGIDGENLSDVPDASEAVRREVRQALEDLLTTTVITGGSLDPERAVSEGVAAARFYRALLNENVPESAAAKMAAAYVGADSARGTDRTVTFTIINEAAEAAEGDR